MNRPYDPRYNANVYVPKLTEAQRQARATPVENLRSVRFRTETPAPEVEQPAPAEWGTTQPDAATAITKRHRSTSMQPDPATASPSLYPDADPDHSPNVEAQRSLNIPVRDRAHLYFERPADRVQKPGPIKVATSACKVALHTRRTFPYRSSPCLGQEYPSPFAPPPQVQDRPDRSPPHLLTPAAHPRARWACPSPRYPPASRPAGMS